MMFVKPELIGLQKDNFVEKIVKLESEMEIIKQKMTTIINHYLVFWKSFTHFKNTELISFKNKLEETVDMKFHLLEKWSSISEYVDFNPIFNLYYKWFLKDFINKDINISEEELNLMSTKHDFQSLASHDYVKNLKLEKVSFYNDTLVVHIDMQEIKLGKIKYVKDYFYYLGNKES